MTKNEQVFENRFERHLDELKWLYMELYDSQEHFEELCSMMKDMYSQRKAALKKLDLEREENPEWFKGNDMLGMMMYTGQFAGNLKGVKKHLDYVKSCGVNYLHLMPLMESPKGCSEGC